METSTHFTSSAASRGGTRPWIAKLTTEFSGPGGAGRGVGGPAAASGPPRKAGAGTRLGPSVPSTRGGLRWQRPRDAHHVSRSAVPAAAAPCTGARAAAAVRRGWGAGVRHHAVLSWQLLERGPRQVHGLRVLSSATAQRLLPGLRRGPFSLLRAAVAHLGGRHEPGPPAGATFWLPGLETVPQERKVYHSHRGDWWGGLSRCGTDPVTMSVPVSRRRCPLFIHSFIHS